MRSPELLAPPHNESGPRATDAGNGAFRMSWEDTSGSTYHLSAPLYCRRAGTSKDRPNLGRGRFASKRWLRPEEAPLTGNPGVACVSPSPTATASLWRGTPAVGEIERAAGGEAEAPLELLTPPPGAPADSALLERIREAEENLASCFNTGNYPAFVALFTPKALLAELGIQHPNDTPANAARRLTPTVASAPMWSLRMRETACTLATSSSSRTAGCCSTR